MNDALKIVCFVLCAFILAGQLYRAKRTNAVNTHWVYHVAAALLALGVSCKMISYVWPATAAPAPSWTDLPLLFGVLIFQCSAVKRWRRDVPREFATAPSELRSEL